MEKLNLQGRALLAPAFLYFTGLLLRHKHHADHAGTDMGADGGAKLGHTAAGQLEILVHVVVYRCNKLLIIAVEQRIAVARVNTAERVQLLEHGDQRAGASAALVHQLDLAVLQGQHRLDAQRTAHNGNGGGQSSALLQVLEAVHHGDDAHPLFELLQHGGDFLRRQALLIAQAHRLTDKQRLSLRGRLRVHDMHLQTDIGGGQMRALVRAGQLLADGDHKDLIPRCGGILIHLHKAGRAGLAWAIELYLAKAYRYNHKYTSDNMEMKQQILEKNTGILVIRELPDTVTANKTEAEAYSAVWDLMIELEKNLPMAFVFYGQDSLVENNKRYDEIGIFLPNSIFLKHLEKHVAKAEAIIYANK